MMREFTSDAVAEARALLMSAQRRIDEAHRNTRDALDRAALMRVRRKVNEAIFSATGARDAMLKEGH